jgi:hypothetical protein
VPHETFDFEHVLMGCAHERSQTTHDDGGYGIDQAVVIVKFMCIENAQFICDLAPKGWRRRNLKAL